jgi:hypothetical protein
VATAFAVVAEIDALAVCLRWVIFVSASGQGGF